MPETVGAAMRRAVRHLSAQGVPDAGRDVRILMAQALDIAPDRVLLHTGDGLRPDAAAAFSRAVARRSGREPVSRILGWREFYGRRFKITPHVLDPRPETEVLIELALQERFGRILDLGTGSGCIALTLLAERRDAVAVATDVSPDALEAARENATTLGVTDRVRFEVSDWFAAVGGDFDLIVSNPPYIDPGETHDLAPEVQRYDPKLALFGRADGLTAYRRIAARAPEHLTPGGRLLVEIGPTQGAEVTDMFREAGLEEVTVHPDLDRRDRVVSGRAPLERN